MLFHPHMVWSGFRINLSANNQITGDQLQFVDENLRDEQFHNRRNMNLPFPANNFNIGDLIFLKSEGSKHEVRHRYIITGIEDNMFIIRKLHKNTFGQREYKVKGHECIRVPSSQNILYFLLSKKVGGGL